jgi:hypothetical protein
MSNPFPVISSIRSFQDVKNALDRIRQWFVSQPISTTTSSTPSEITKAAGIVIAPGKTLTIEQNWNLRGLTSGKVGKLVDSTRYVEVVINGENIKLAVVK